MTPQDEINSLRQALADVERQAQAKRYELHHRMRNMLAVIRALIRGHSVGAEGDMPIQRAEGQVDAFARAQGTALADPNGRVPLLLLLADEVRSVTAEPVADNIFRGTDVMLTAQAAGLVALVVHEVAGLTVHSDMGKPGSLRATWSIADERLRIRLRVALAPAQAMSRTETQDKLRTDMVWLCQALSYTVASELEISVSRGQVVVCVVMPMENLAVGDAAHG